MKQLHIKAAVEREVQSWASYLGITNPSLLSVRRDYVWSEVEAGRWDIISRHLPPLTVLQLVARDALCVLGRVLRVVLGVAAFFLTTASFAAFGFLYYLLVA
jgi:hypothetical protein